MSSSLGEKKLFLLDMDGTLYLGNTLFPRTKEFLSYLAESGRRAVYLTNNSSKSVSAYVEKLSRLGIDACEDDFFTSVEATIDYMRAHYKNGEKVYVFGTRSFYERIASSGINATDEYGEDIKVLLCGYDTELTYKKIEDACRLLFRGCDFIATNPDWVCPTEYGCAPDCGSVCWTLTKATGKIPRYIGKPEPEMVISAAAKYGYALSETALVGDRIYTDIASGKAAGVQSLFVLCGEGTLEDIEKMKIEPDRVFADVGEICDELKKYDSDNKKG